MSNDAGACRLRVRYVKEGRLAHLGHLEVMGTVLRSVRRAELPFEVSEGFAKRMRIQFSQALPVGASSVAEYYDLLMPVRLDAQEALDRLKAATPTLLAPQEARVLPRRMPALEAWANRALWDVDILGEDVTPDAVRDGIEAALQKGTLEFMRGTKPRTLDLTSTLVSYELEAISGGADDDGGRGVHTRGVHLGLDTRVTERGSLRPAVLINAVLGRAPNRVCRLSQWHEERDGSLTSPMSVG
ncbi:MAG: TIGR03936 family radical SAM-associated protein [Atopobiaceae bacterium]|nr:TIGR03936 family radical SAM-associated protein [Atopobiaceae bacterium]